MPQLIPGSEHKSRSTAVVDGLGLLGYNQIGGVKELFRAWPDHPRQPWPKDGELRTAVARAARTCREIVVACAEVVARAMIGRRPAWPSGFFC